MLESDPVIKTLRKIEGRLSHLRVMAQTSEFWIGQPNRESISTAKKT